MNQKYSAIWKKIFQSQMMVLPFLVASSGNAGLVVELIENKCLDTAQEKIKNLISDAKQCKEKSEALVQAKVSISYTQKSQKLREESSKESLEKSESSDKIAAALSKENLLNHFKENERVAKRYLDKKRDTLVHDIYVGEDSESFLRLSGMAKAYNLALGFPLKTEDTHVSEKISYSESCQNVISGSLALSTRLKAATDNNPLLQSIQPGEEGYAVFDPLWPIKKEPVVYRDLRHDVMKPKKFSDQELIAPYIQKWIPVQTPEAFDYYAQSLQKLSDQLKVIANSDSSKKINCAAYDKPGFGKGKVFIKDPNILFEEGIDGKKSDLKSLHELNRE